jgi:hypothetical protein
MNAVPEHLYPAAKSFSGVVLCTFILKGKMAILQQQLVGLPFDLRHFSFDVGNLLLVEVSPHVRAL